MKRDSLIFKYFIGLILSWWEDWCIYVLNDKGHIMTWFKWYHLLQQLFLITRKFLTCGCTQIIISRYSISRFPNKIYFPMQYKHIIGNIVRNIIEDIYLHVWISVENIRIYHTNICTISLKTHDITSLCSSKYESDHNRKI